MKKNLHIIIISLLFSVVLWVSISLSNDYFTILKIPVKLMDFPTGYATGNLSPRQVSVKIKGKGWKLISVYLSSDDYFLVPVGTKTGRRNLKLSNYLVDNQWLTTELDVSSISPDTLSFVVEKTISKKLPVVSDLNLNFRSGYGLASPLTITPETTVVTGPATYVEKLSSIPTRAVKFDNLESVTTGTVPLKRYFGMSYMNRSVQVTLNVQKIVDKNFDNIPVNVVDLPRDRNVLLLPNQISIGVRAGIDVLGKLDTSQFNAYVNYREVVLDTLGSVVPHIDMPGNTSLLFIKPERLRYIIKKF